jgi:hypothetical protein
MPTGPVESTAAIVFNSTLDPGFFGLFAPFWYGLLVTFEVQKLSYVWREKGI